MSEPERQQLSAARRLALRALPWLVTAACFAFLYTRLASAAQREGLEVAGYLAQIFQNVSWAKWLVLMVPYSVFFFAVDTLVAWRVISWFNVPVRYTDILPIRGAAYILSILNEQVGKGAMALYLNRRDGVPAWEVGSSMLFVMFCEFYYLLIWATIGVWLRWDQLPPVFHWIPLVAVAASLFLALWLAFFSGRFLPHLALRKRPVLLAFRKARLANYAVIILLRSPALLAAVVVYTISLRMFGLDVSYLQMLGYLPVIFFGAATPGPMRSVAITLWVVLFPDRPGEMTAFGFVMHNFFIFFNAALGLIFLRRANRELFSTST